MQRLELETETVMGGEAREVRGKEGKRLRVNITSITSGDANYRLIH